MIPVVDLLNRVEDQATEHIIAVMEGVFAELMGSDGRTYGDVVPDRAARIARFMDLASRGVMDHLEAMSPKTAKMLADEFVRDVQASQIGAPK